MVRNVTAWPVDLDPHPLADPQQPDPAGVEGVPVVGQLDAVVEQHRPRAAARVEAAHGRLHPANLSGPRPAGPGRGRGARAVHRPTPSSSAASRSAAVSTSRRSDGQGVGADLVPAGAGMSGRRPRAEHRPEVLGRAGQQQRGAGALPRPGRSFDRDRCASRSATASSAGRSAGRSAARVPTEVPGRCRDASLAPCTSAGFRPASGSSPVTSAPIADSAFAACRSSVTTCTARDDGAGERCERGVQCKGQCEVARWSSYGGPSRVLATGSRLTGSTRHHRRLASSTGPILPVALDTGTGGREDVGPGEPTGSVAGS